MTTDERNRVEWPSPRATPGLAKNEIHVWRASLPTDQVTLRRFASTLGDAEAERAARFVFDRDRDRFIASHGILRALLGGYMECAPQAIGFELGLRGKPAIARRGSAPAPAPSFNLAHSHALAVIAVGRQREIGVDIELMRPEIAGEDIARRYFSTKEFDELSRQPAESRTEGFFLCWTRKEAYVKARGDGLHTPLDSFDVSLSPGTPATLSSADESRWAIEAFDPSPSAEMRYAGAVAAEGRDWTARYFEWTEHGKETAS